MKHIIRILTIAAVLLAGAAAKSAPILQSGWTTTTVPATARNAMGVPAETNGTLYGTVGFGELTLPALVNIYGTNKFWDVTGSSSANLYFTDPYFTFSESISVPGINLNGDFRTTWPSGGAGTGSPFTNIVVKTSDNNPSPDQGAALVIRPQEVSTNPGFSAVWTEWLPTYTNDSYKGKFRHTITAVTNTLGDLLPDINWNISYNGGGNSAGVSTYGLTDTNEPVWIEQKESRWQNLAGFSQLEWWDYFATPYTSSGTNFGMRWWTGTLIWNTTTKAFVRSEAKTTVSTWELQNPTATSGLAGVLLAANGANNDSYTMTLKGSVIIHTNDAGIGEIKAEGGLITAGVPDSVTASSLILRVDYANQLGSVDDQAYIYSAGNVKALHIGASGSASTMFSNIVANTNLTVTGGTTSTNGFRSRANLNFVLSPTNHPTAVGDVQTITGTNAAGHVTTAWGPQSGGGYHGWETNTALANSYTTTNRIKFGVGFDATNGVNNLGALAASTDGSAAAAGVIGEDQTNTLASGSAVSLTTGTTANITSLALEAGDWFVGGAGVFNPDTTTTTTYLQSAISTTSATLPADTWDTALWNGAVADQAIDASVPAPFRRIRLTTPTTVYLVVRSGFATSTMTAYGRIYAWRPR